MKKLLRRLNIIDFIAFGTGLCLTIAYILYKNSFQPNSPWLDLWPNISTEVIGIWISVRVIDELIQRREKKRSLREATIGGLNFFLESAKQLKPEYYDWRINELQTELKWFQKKYLERKRYFFTDEKKLADQAVALEKKIVIAAQTYSSRRNQILILKTNYPITFDRATEIRNGFEKELRNYETSFRKNSSGKLPEFNELIKGKENYFSDGEIASIRSSYESIKVGVGLEEYNRIEWWELIPSLHSKNCFRVLEVEFDKLRDIASYPEQAIADAVTQIENAIDKQNYPPVLLEINKEFGQIVKELALSRAEIDGEIELLDKVVKDFSENVMEESEAE